MKIFAIRVRDKYGPEYEEYLNKKLGDVTYIREEEHPFMVQWNKLRIFNYDIDEPVCIVDLDIELVNNYMELFEYPIKRGEFVSLPAHWGDYSSDKYTLNGGFYKFYPKDVKYIYDKFLEDPNQNKYYVEKLKLKHPLFGEQFFVEDQIKERLQLKLVPEDWVQRGTNGKFLDDGIVKIVHHSFRQPWGINKTVAT